MEAKNLAKEHIQATVTETVVFAHLGHPVMWLNILSFLLASMLIKARTILPIFMVVAAIYGVENGNKRNNFGRNLVLQNLLYKFLSLLKPK
ncbi:MAG: hypothetical protein WC140_05010 [Bacteroidales bacterium]